MDFKKLEKKFSSAKAGILTNQSAFGGKLGFRYHFEYFKEEWNLTHIFLPEHGLFAELQDQVSGSSLKYNYGNIKIINLYGDDESSLTLPMDELEELELIIIDIRDVGARYYTFLTSAYYIMKSVHDYNQKTQKSSIELLVIDSPNPIGRRVEGSPLKLEYESFVGVHSVLHRHGLTPAELLLYYKETFSLNVKIHICEIGEVYSKKDEFWIPPSPNIPNQETCLVYPGQCLLEGTNLSEGRGTTRPFEIFGAPFIDVQNRLLLVQLNRYANETYHLRPLYFQPTFHKHANKICGGFQLILLSKKFHSLLFTLYFLRTIRDFYNKEFEYLQGAYEFRSDKRAIELLAGDEVLIDYLEGNGTYPQIREYLREKEDEWEDKIEEIKIY
ncbi:MAG: DUF1343 domain-containing protein [Leptospiraceae bacterium]|nr:DUF1343 domain-containing protein [Leptospiraceae bacterium]